MQIKPFEMNYKLNNGQAQDQKNKLKVKLKN